MEIFTIDRKEGDFITIYKEPFRNKALSLKARGLLATLLALGPRWQFSVKGISSILKERRDAIYSTIKELQEAGYCHRYDLMDENNRFAGTHYAFSEYRRDWPEKYDGPLPDFPQVENPYTEKPDTGNPPQYNNEIDIRKKGKNKEIIYGDRDFLAGLIALGVNPETADAWMVVRHKAKAVSTRVAFDGIAREVAKSGLPAEDCIRTAVERSWRGFKAEWLRRETPQPLTPSPRQESLVEHNRRVLEEVLNGIKRSNN